MKFLTSSRAASSVVSTVLMVAVVVILASTVSVFALDFADETTRPTPVVAQSSGELVTQEGNDGGIVQLTHLGGDTLTASNLEIAVNAQSACGKTGQLVNLPADGGDPLPESEYVRGDDVFDNSYNSVSGPIGEAGGKWEPSETASFRLASSDCELNSGDTITVQVIHTPTDSIVIEEKLTAA